MMWNRLGPFTKAVIGILLVGLAALLLGMMVGCGPSPTAPSIPPKAVSSPYDAVASCRVYDALVGIACKLDTVGDGE